MTPEGYVKKAINKELALYGEHADAEMPVPTGFGKSGLDFTVCFYGWYLAIEAKRPGQKPTPRQYLKIANVQAAGGIAVWYDTIERVQTELRALLRDLSWAPRELPYKVTT